MQTTFAPPAVVADLQAIVDSIKAKHRAKQAAALAHYVPMAAETVASRVAFLKASLAEARLGFDPAYPYCDDYTEWARQSGKASMIRYCESELAKLGEVAA